VKLRHERHGANAALSESDHEKSAMVLVGVQVGQCALGADFPKRADRPMAARAAPGKRRPHEVEVLPVSKPLPRPNFFPTSIPWVDDPCAWNKKYLYEHTSALP